VDKVQHHLAQVTQAVAVAAQEMVELVMEEVVLLL
jgi:hypothetical protein